MKQRLILIASVVIGLLAAVLTRQYLKAKDREVERKIDQLTQANRRTRVVAVNKSLPAGSVLAAGDLCSIEVVESAVRSHVVREADYTMLLNKKLVRSLEKEAPVYWSDVEGGNPLAGGLANDIKPRLRAISLGIGGAAAVSGMVRPGDHVDILGTFTLPSAAKPNEMELVTQTVLQDVLILATGQETAKSASAASGRGSSYNTVTIEVTPREAEMLVFAEQVRGRLVLTLRHPADTYTERDLPRVDFAKIQSEIEELNKFRQEQLWRKR